MSGNKPALQIIYADTSLVVVDKPSGLLSVPGRGPHNQDCVVSRIKDLIPECIAQPAVHRLDMQTSGLMVLALTADAHRHLSRQFEQRLVQKRYIAILDGIIAQEAGEITLAFRLDPDNRPYQVYDPIRGKPGTSLWRKLQIANGQTRVEFTPQSGRTHQLRLHAAHVLGLNCPIVGDSLYGHGAEGEEMLLHASFLSFRHPDTGKPVEFTSPAPF
jgi:tRNA pseudouridine32 synthase/23S rRNA pseudouridine746 synthase